MQSTIQLIWAQEFQPQIRRVNAMERVSEDSNYDVIKSNKGIRLKPTNKYKQVWDSVFPSNIVLAISLKRKESKNGAPKVHGIISW